MVRRSALALVAVLPALAGCGGGLAGVEPSAPTVTTAPAERKLVRNGVSIAVPEGWDGRILFREPTGTVGVLFQLANFELPANEGLEPPPEEPGRPDPLAAMAGDDVLVTVATDEPDGAPARGRIGLDGLSFLPGGSPRVPVGHALAEGSVCHHARCFRISVDFGSAPADRGLARRVDELLASIAVDARPIEADGLRLDVPAGWHAYSTTVGPGGSQPVVWAANVPFLEGPSRPAFASETLRELPPAGIVVEAVGAPSSGPGSSAPFTSGGPVRLDRPPRLADGTFHSDGYEGQQAPHLSMQIVEGRIGNRTFLVHVYFGRNEPTDAMRAAADGVLASLTLRGSTGSRTR